MSEASVTTTTMTMNYKAVASTIPKKNNSMIQKKNSEESYEEYLAFIENEDFQRRANIQMNEIVNRFLKYKTQDLKLEGYDDEEIEAIINYLIHNECDEYYDYSSDEDDGSVYSDEDSF
tara:strand:+ start:2792 stop:3148 length:357 start_codon:yes stop_codon:yes gene_type:complete